jgi:hypothetical protein
MIRRRTARHFGTFLASLLLAILLLSSSAHAGIILYLFPDPPTTAGVATSTRSGPGAWQLYAIEDAASTDLGIASYNITLAGTTALNHRSPNGTAIDSNGDTQNWGFTLLRSGTNTNPFVASEPLLGTTPFVITGFGRSAGSANSQVLAADPGAIAVAAISGASWGTYTTVGTNFEMSGLESSTGHKFVFLAEGLGAPTILSAAFTVLSNAQGAQIAGTWNHTTPEPAACSLVLTLLSAAGFVRRRAKNLAVV